MEAGRHWLPGSLFGGRETLVTSPLAARPWQLLSLPGDGWLPLLAAVGTAGFFLLLTPGWVLPASACGLLALGSIIGWLWQSDRPPPAAQARVGEHCSVPTVARGARSHAWWAMLLLLAVDASIFASLAFAHLHTAMALEICPPPGASLPGGGMAGGVIGLLLLGSALIVWAGRHVGRAPLRLSAALLLAMLCVAASAGLDLGSQLAQGLSPTRNAWSATVAALLGWQVLHAALLLLMGAYLIARALSGRLQEGARASFDNSALMWHYVSLQGAAGLLLVQWMAAG